MEHQHPHTLQWLSHNVVHASSISIVPSLLCQPLYTTQPQLHHQLPIGTPPRAQVQQVLDTVGKLGVMDSIPQYGTQEAYPNGVVWPFPSTFSILPCIHPLCKPRIPDFTAPLILGRATNATNARVMILGCYISFTTKIIFRMREISNVFKLAMFLYKWKF